MQRKRLSMLIAVAMLTASVFAQVSPRTAVWLKPAESIHWKTLMENPAELALNWPAGATKATLSVDAGVGHPATYDITNTELKWYSFAVSAPRLQKDERVLQLTLVYKAADDKPLGVETARVGLVGGVNGTVTRCILDASSSKWKKADGDSAVLPIPGDALSLTIDAEDVSPLDPNGWYFLKGEPGQTAMVAMTTESGVQSAEIRFGGAGMLILFR